MKYIFLIKPYVCRLILKWSPIKNIFDLHHCFGITLYSVGCEKIIDWSKKSAVMLGSNDSIRVSLLNQLFSCKKRQWSSSNWQSIYTMLHISFSFTTRTSYCLKADYPPTDLQWIVWRSIKGVWLHSHRQRPDKYTYQVSVYTYLVYSS